MHRRALTIREKFLGPNHPEVGESLVNLATVVASKNKFEEASQLYDRALKIHERALGLTHPRTQLTLSSLVLVLKKAGRNDEADSLQSKITTGNQEKGK